DRVRSRLFGAGPIKAVDEEDVLPAVGVVVDECAARSERLGEQLAAIGTAVMTELQAGRPGDVGQLKADRCQRLCEEVERKGRQRCAGPAPFKELSSLHRGLTSPFCSA